MVTFIEILPIIIAVGLPATFISTYIWSVCIGHVYPILPTISDTGTIPPESCLFSMLLNCIAATLVFAVYVRHKQIVELFRPKVPFKCARVVNTVATISGLVACIGMDIVANFQETNVLIVHGLGAMICFWASAFYIFLQVVLSYWIVPEMTGMAIVIIRGLQGILAVIFLILNMITQSMSFSSHGMKNDNQTEILHWNPDQPGWKWHVAASICEWSVVVTFSTFILTYHWDFKKITLYAPEIEMIEDEQKEAECVQPTNFRSLEAVAS